MNHKPTYISEHPFGARRVDHIALTVPDLDAAITFAVQVLGGELVYRLPAMACDDDWMLHYLDVHPRARVEIAMVRLGPVTNLELFQYWAPDRCNTPLRPHDAGSTTLGLLVEDVDIALTFLQNQFGVRAFSTVYTAKAEAPEAGMRWVRFMAPWGAPIELRSMPLVGEETHIGRRFGPCVAWSNRNDGTTPPSSCMGSVPGPVPGSVPGPLPGARNVDHIAYTVADLHGAVMFFVDVLGAELLYRTSANLERSLLAQALGVPAEGDVARAVLRMGPTDNVELICYRTHDAGKRPPRNSDVGGRHLAFHVDDVASAAAYLALVPGCTVLGSPQTIGDGPIAGDQWVYVRTPIDLHIELVRMPDGALPYETGTSARRRPACGLRWSDR